MTTFSTLAVLVATAVVTSGIEHVTTDLLAFYRVHRVLEKSLKVFEF